MTHYNGIIAATPRQGAEALAAQIIRDLRATLDQRAVARVVFSTGATPVQVYASLRNDYRTALPWDRVCVYQLDEYSGLSSDDPRRFDAFLREQLIAPLGAAFRPLCGEASAGELLAHEADIARAGGLDLVLYGVGVNGHLGFNEPGSAFDAPSRRVALHATTRERISTLEGPAPTEAATLGLATLNAARCIRVVAWGAAKREALTQGLLRSPDTASPLSSLQTHPNVQFYLDAEAAPAGLVLRAVGQPL